jgi:hypothetical protein
MMEAHEVDARACARFWARVDRETTPDGCWPWTGKLNRDGRGRFTVDGETTYAYRWSYVLARGQVAVGDVVRHLCGTPACCRPDHLAVGGQRENNLDTVYHGRHRSAKLDPTKVKQIRARMAAPDRPSGLLIASEFGVSPSAISRVVTGKTWARSCGDMVEQRINRRKPDLSLPSDGSES